MWFANIKNPSYQQIFVLPSGIKTWYIFRETVLHFTVTSSCMIHTISRLSCAAMLWKLFTNCLRWTSKKIMKNPRMSQLDSISIVGSCCKLFANYCYVIFSSSSCHECFKIFIFLFFSTSKTLTDRLELSTAQKRFHKNYRLSISLMKAATKSIIEIDWFLPKNASTAKWFRHFKTLNEQREERKF